jgi:N-acetylglucosaminyl-diphospho-decaprenol L-rhamnosyltransferase
LLLNPDCEIAEAAMIRLFETSNAFPNAAILAPHAVNGAGEAQESFGPAFFRAQPRGYRVAEAVCSAEWLSGCCLLLRMEAFEARAAFDEQFFSTTKTTIFC